MKIAGIAELEFNDRTFAWKAKEYAYNDVTALTFSATVTSRSVNGIPTGKSYDAKLRVHLPREILAIEPAKGWLGKLKADGFEALQRANSVFAELTFNARLANYEGQVEKRNFFNFNGTQFHRDGQVFVQGREIGNLRSGDIVLSLAPFTLTIKRKTSGFGARVAAIFSKDDTVDLSTDRDCMIYMLKNLYGVGWKGERIREKRVDRERVFYEAVVRFGAMLAMADGDADPNELRQLKRFFSIDDAKLPSAARIFNEALHAKASVARILGIFAKEFTDASEIKEAFLVGMLSVALADGVFDRREYELIQSAARYLGLSTAAFDRILATAGLSGSDFGSGRTNEKQRQSTSQSPRLIRLRLLGLVEGAEQHAIGVAYRTLVKRYHPDVLRGQGMPQAEIAKAEAILVQINLAYEWLMNDAA